jgi:hypothetical protein
VVDRHGLFAPPELTMPGGEAVLLVSTIRRHFVVGVHFQQPGQCEREVIGPESLDTADQPIRIHTSDVELHCLCRADGVVCVTNGGALGADGDSRQFVTVTESRQQIPGDRHTWYFGVQASTAEKRGSVE